MRNPSLIADSLELAAVDLCLLLFGKVLQHSYGQIPVDHLPATQLQVKCLWDTRSKNTSTTAGSWLQS